MVTEEQCEELAIKLLEDFVNSCECEGRLHAIKVIHKLMGVCIIAMNQIASSSTRTEKDN